MANVKGAALQPLIGDLAFQQHGGVHLDVVLMALFRGPVLGFFAMAGWAELRREAKGLQKVVEEWAFSRVWLC